MDDIFDVETTELSQGPEQVEPEQAEPEKKPCPECGKELTWLANGSRPRKHKCEPKEAPAQESQPAQAGTTLVCSQCGALPGGCEHAGTSRYRMVTYDHFKSQPQPDEKKVTMDKVVARYIETRDELAEIAKRHKEELAPLKDLQEKRENWMKGQLDSNGVDSMKTKFGTCFVDVKDSASVADWDTFFKWVQENGKWGFLNHAVNKTEVKQHLGDGETVPPGVNYTTFRTVKIRRA